MELRPITGVIGFVFLILLSPQKGQAQFDRMGMFQENMAWQNPAFFADGGGNQVLLQRADLGIFKEVTANRNILNYRGATKNGGFGLGYYGHFFDNNRHHALQAAYALGVDLSDKHRLVGGVSAGYSFIQFNTPPLVENRGQFLWNSGLGITSEKWTLALSYGGWRNLSEEQQQVITLYAEYAIQASSDIQFKPLVYAYLDHARSVQNVTAGVRVEFYEKADIGIIFSEDRDNVLSMAISVTERLRLGYAIHTSFTGLFQWPQHELLVAWTF